jgi:hypothetical protein
MYCEYMTATVLRDQTKNEIGRGMFRLIVGATGEQRGSLDVGGLAAELSADSDDSDKVDESSSGDSGAGKHAAEGIGHNVGRASSNSPPHIGSFQMPRNSRSGSIRFKPVNLEGHDVQDEDEEETITIRDLQIVLKNCGQDLSVNDVYNVIKDIDENGDGKLNEEEFKNLLGKLRIL